MSVETASYIDDLVATNPAVTDFLYEGDDHLRLIKAVLLASFPNIGGAVTLTHTELNAALRPTTAGQWTLMKDTTVSGTPSAIDFVNGTGGVVISSLADDGGAVDADEGYDRKRYAERGRLCERHGRRCNQFALRSVPDCFHRSTVEQRHYRRAAGGVGKRWQQFPGCCCWRKLRARFDCLGRLDSGACYRRGLHDCRKHWN